MEGPQVNPILSEIEHWQSIYDWLRQEDGFDKEAEHVKTLISKIVLGIHINPTQGPSA